MMVTSLKEVSRSELSRVTGIDMAHISRICNGKARPSLRLATQIAEYLGITVEQLNELLDNAAAGRNQRRDQLDATSRLEMVPGSPSPTTAVTTPTQPL